ncbi:hypothetical protein VIGAN_UM050900 [Vigna angularis var. angularis]|uniref:Uncharacterized protein n=1 Tax=Vigna angularis var. angularis TaxID=157739 RepID=A0A0S3TDU4_PHAAN|nr:hypothetical protein VIGAN_UM050900 [Vigna angularis var. angularis]
MQPDQQKKMIVSWDEMIEKGLGNFGWTQFLQCILVSVAMFFDSQQLFIGVYTDDYRHGTAPTTRQHAPQIPTSASSKSLHGNGMDPLPRQSFHSLAFNVPAASSQVYPNPPSSSVAFSVPFFLHHGRHISRRKNMIILSCLSMSVISIVIIFSTNVLALEWCTLGCISSGKLELQHIPCSWVECVDGNTVLRGDLFLGKLREKVIDSCVLSRKWDMLHSVCGDSSEGVKVGFAVASFFCACTAFNVFLIFMVELFPTCVRNTAGIGCETGCGVWVHVQSVSDICWDERTRFSLMACLECYNLLHFDVVGFARDKGMPLSDTMDQQQNKEGNLPL